MEFLLSFCAKVSVPIFGYHFYQYYQLTNLEKLIMTSPQINLDYMPISKDLEGKECLFFGSLKDIVQNSKSVENFQLYTDYDVPNKKNHIKNVKLNENLNLNLRFLEESYVDVDLEQEKTYKFYDFPPLKSKLVKENNNLTNDLLLWEKTYLKTLFSKEKKVFKTWYGLTKDQQILVYGFYQLILGTFKYGEIIKIKPRFFLGSGTVEIKEIIDFMKQKINIRLFGMMMGISGITVIHFVITAFR